MNAVSSAGSSSSTKRLARGAVAAHRLPTGAFGTKAAAHAAGLRHRPPCRHAYHTFYPGIENGMLDEMTQRLVELFNTTGLRQISFDGLEGLSAYGYGEYARNRFVKQCYDGWNPEVISDASNLLHYLWHIHTRMNWGEPWGKAMREGQTESASTTRPTSNATCFPHARLVRTAAPPSADLEATTLDDVEWMLAKAAGYDAGFAISTDLAALRGNAQTPAILAAVREWEAARLAGRFSAEQREALLGPDEFHLVCTAEGGPRLCPVAFSPILSHTPTEDQAEEAQWTVENKFAAQPVRFVLRSAARQRRQCPNHPSVSGDRGTLVYLPHRAPAAAVPGLPWRAGSIGL